MRNLQDLTNHLGQKTTVLTFDQAIYFKAKEIQWDKKDEFNDFILRLGGFHMLTSYMAAVGKLMKSGGMTEILRESGLYGDVVITQITAAKHYSRTVRAHKLMFEALSRFLLEALGNQGTCPPVDLPEMDDQDTLGSLLQMAHLIKPHLDEMSCSIK